MSPANTTNVRSGFLFLAPRQGKRNNWHQKVVDKPRSINGWGENPWKTAILPTSWILAMSNLYSLLRLTCRWLRSFCWLSGWGCTWTTRCSVKGKRQIDTTKAPECYKWMQVPLVAVCKLVYLNILYIYIYIYTYIHIYIYTYIHIYIYIYMYVCILCARYIHTWIMAISYTKVYMHALTTPFQWLDLK